MPLVPSWDIMTTDLDSAPDTTRNNTYVIWMYGVREWKVRGTWNGRKEGDKNRITKQMIPSFAKHFSLFPFFFLFQTPNEELQVISTSSIMKCKNNSFFDWILFESFPFFDWFFTGKNSMWKIKDVQLGSNQGGQRRALGCSYFKVHTAYSMNVIPGANVTTLLHDCSKREPKAVVKGKIIWNGWSS